MAALTTSEAGLNLQKQSHFYLRLSTRSQTTQDHFENREGFCPMIVFPKLCSAPGEQSLRVRRETYCKHATLWEESELRERWRFAVVATANSDWLRLLRCTTLLAAQTRGHASTPLGCGLRSMENVKVGLGAFSCRHVVSDQFGFETAAGAALGKLRL